MTITNEKTMKTIGLILEALAIPVMIVNIVLLNMSNTDIQASTILLIISNFMLFTGLILSHLPKKTEKEEETEK